MVEPGPLPSTEEKLASLPQQIIDQLPTPEPKPKTQGGWLYRALEPCYSKQSVIDVKQALTNGEISSGTQWPKKMAAEICKLYNVPVCLPTCSGAGALHVALLATDIYGKEVICPSLTMVAVANMVS